MTIKPLLSNRKLIASLIVLATGLLLAYGLAQPVVATHTVPHCNEVYEGQVPQQVIDDCKAAVEQRCADQYINGPTVNEAAYGICVNGSTPTSGGSVEENSQEIDFGVECEGNSENCCNGVQLSVGVECVESDNPIISYFGGIINFLAGGVLLVVTAMIVAGGIQFITAGGVPQRLEAARRRIINAVIALVTFIFLYGILQWLIPGGII